MGFRFLYILRLKCSVPPDPSRTVVPVHCVSYGADCYPDLSTFLGDVSASVPKWFGLSAAWSLVHVKVSDTRTMRRYSFSETTPRGLAPSTEARLHRGLLSRCREGRDAASKVPVSGLEVPYARVLGGVPEDGVTSVAVAGLVSNRSVPLKAADHVRLDQSALHACGYQGGLMLSAAPGLYGGPPEVFDRLWYSDTHPANPLCHSGTV